MEVSNSIIFSVDGRDDIIRSIIHEFRHIPMNQVPRIGDLHSQVFKDGEVCTDYNTSVRGKRVYLVCSPNSAEKIMMLNLAIDAAKRAAAKEIIPILPYFPYARQDKKDQSRGPIGAKVLAEMLENRGATHVITFDLHADQIQGFFNIPVTHMEGKYVFDRYIHDIQQELGNVTLCAPDAGATKRVKHYRDLIKLRWDIELPMVMIDKTRKKANEVAEMFLIGEVKDQNVLIIDDMCDTGGTLVKAAEELIKFGAKSVRAIVTHGVFSDPAFARFSGSKLEEVVCSDSLPVPTYLQVMEMADDQEEHAHFSREGFKKVNYVTTARQIFLAIQAIDNNVSIEDLKNRN